VSLASELAELLAEAATALEARTTDVSTLAEAVEAGATGFARIRVGALGPDGEDRHGLPLPLPGKFAIALVLAYFAGAGFGGVFTYFGDSPFDHGSYVCANTSRCASGGCEYSQNVISAGGFGSASPISPRI